MSTEIELFTVIGLVFTYLKVYYYFKRQNQINNIIKQYTVIDDTHPPTLVPV